MKLKFIYSIVYLSFIFQLLSCDKSILDNDIKNQLDVRTTSINPFDSIGIMHNYYLSNVDWEGAVNFYDLIDSFNTFYGQNVITDSFMTRCGVVLDSNKIALNNERLNFCDFSLAANNYMIALIDTIQIYGENWSVTDAVNFTQRNEGIVYNSTLFSVTDKEKLYKFLAVFKYSSDYWYNYSISQIDQIQTRGGGWKWWRTALCDAFGGVVGGVIGGPIGAGIGAAVASGADGLAQHFGWGTTIRFGW